MSSKQNQALMVNRRPSRSIKRKRFDDDYVESNLEKIFRGREPRDDSGERSPGDSQYPFEFSTEGAQASDEGKRQTVPSSASYSAGQSSTNQMQGAVGRPSAGGKFRPNKKVGLTKRRQKSTKTIRWKPEDDLLLISAVLQTRDLVSVHMAVKFSCHFSLRDIQDRWYNLLYDARTSKLSLQAIRSLRADIVQRLLARTLFSKEEEDILKDIPSTHQHASSLETFQQALLKHPLIFHSLRTPQVLQCHWNLLKKYQLLNDQTVSNEIRSFSDMEDDIFAQLSAERANPVGVIGLSSTDNSLVATAANSVGASAAVPSNSGQTMGHSAGTSDGGTSGTSGTSTSAIGNTSATANSTTTPSSGSSTLQQVSANLSGSCRHLDSQDSLLSKELVLADHRAKEEIKRLELEIPRWQFLVNQATGLVSQDFDNCTLAVLRGKLVRYLMRSREITLGRSAPDHTVDVDLSLEGPATKVSRLQGTIKLKSTGEFYLLNHGKRPFYVDGIPLLRGERRHLTNNSIVKVASLAFIFLINTEVNAMFQAESNRQILNS